MVKLPSERVSLHSHYFFQPTLLGNSPYFIYEKEKENFVYNYIYNFQKSTKEKINIFLCINVMKGDDKINI